MSDNVAITPGSGATIAADEVVDGTLGTVKVQYVKIMDGTLDGTSKAAVGANGLKVDGSAVTQPVSGTVTANQGSANATPWNENVAQVGGVAVAAKAAGPFGTSAIPVWTNAYKLSTYQVPINAISSGAMVAATRKDILSLEQAAASGKTIRIRRIVLSVVCTTAPAVAGLLQVNLFRGVAASTGGSAVTCVATNQGAAALNANFAAKTLPTIVAATGPIPLGAVWVSAIGNGFQSTVVYDWQEGGETEVLTLRAGNLESWVIGLLHSSTPTMTVHGYVTITEE